MALSPPDPALLLSAIIENSDDAIASKDLQGIVTSWNGAAERMFGYTAAEIVGKSIRLIIPADRQGEEDEVLSRIGRGEAVRHFETIRQHKNGTLIAISLTVSPVRAPDGAIVGVSKIARDISARRTAEVALVAARASEADLQRRLLALVSASGALFGSPRGSDVLPATLRVARELIAADGYAIWRLDPASHAWSVAAQTGISKEFAGQIIASYHGRDAGALPFREPLIVEDVRTIALLEERRASYEREGIRSILAIPLTVAEEASGTLVFYYREPHRFSEVEVRTAQALGNLVGVAMTTAALYDELEHSHAQAEFLATSGAALAGSLNYEATLRQMAALAVPRIADWCAIDLAGEEGKPERLTIAHSDPARVEFARTFEQSYPGDPDSPYSVAQVIRAGKPVIVEHVSDELLRAGARSEQHLQALRSVNITSVMIVPLVARGRTLGAITFVAAESGRRYSTDDLHFAEDIAARAALSVDNARAYDEARRANRLKDDFLATLSHELRTPLNAILGYARMLKTGVLGGEKQRRALDVLERSASSLTQIVEDVLDVSRIITGKIRLNILPVDLTAVVSNAVAAMLPAIEAKEITIETSFDPGVPRLTADADRLQQVVWNLVSNAVKFTPRRGRIAVSISAAGGFVEMTVTDTGIGFAPEFAPHAFERFRQADSGFAREHGGLGLGLAITRHLVEMHGGTIQADSEGQGKGATFRVRLPIAGTHDDQVESPIRRSAGAPPHAVESLDSVEVLAVDDDEDALILVREILEAAGARVTTVRSAAEALAELGRAAPDVLLADLGMPGMDGFGLIDAIRRSASTSVRSLPAAALTAYARSEDRINALRHGFQMHLAKPIDPIELVAAIATLTGHSSAPAS